MTAEEIVTYEQLGEHGHFADLPKALTSIELRRRHWKTGDLPDDMISRRLQSYKNTQSLMRAALHSGELRSVLLVSETGEEIENPPQAWAQDNAMNWFEDGVAYILTGGTRKISDGLYVPGLPDELNFLVEPNSVEARVLIDIDSFSDWYFSGTGPMADVPAVEPDKGGRPLEYDWSAVEAFVVGLVKQHGKPGKGNRMLPSKSDLTQTVLGEWASRDVHLAESTVRRYITRWLDKL